MMYQRRIMMRLSLSWDVPTVTNGRLVVFISWIQLILVVIIIVITLGNTVYQPHIIVTAASTATNTIGGGGVQSSLPSSLDDYFAAATSHDPQRTFSTDLLSQQRRHGDGSSTTTNSRRRRDRSLDFLRVVSQSRAAESTDCHSKTMDMAALNEFQQQQLPQSRNRFWPPWPFNVLQQQQQQQQSSSEDNNDNDSPPPTLLYQLLRYTKISTKVGIRTVQEFGSQLWYHSPPAIPPILLYALWPYRTRTIISTSTSSSAAVSNVVVSENIVYKTVLPIWSNGFVRNGILVTSALAITSWAHTEINRRRKLTPLPLLYHDLLRAELPPFLPPQVTSVNTVPYIADSKQEDGEMGSSALMTTPSRSDISDVPKTDVVTDGREGIEANLSPRRWRRRALQFRIAITPRPSYLWNKVSDWGQLRQQYKTEQQNAQRLAIYKELMVWQKAITARQKSSTTSTKKANHIRNHPNKFLRKWIPFRKHSSTFTSGNDDSSHVTAVSNLGYALVTGASQGIGRAIAVELARWHIPLILVARDIQALTELAYDIETCYGIDCTVLSADLSRPNASEQIYKTVTDAGLKVDILVNNAGVSSHGETLNMPLADVQRMIQVNTMAVTSLTHLFGRDMKERRRGRILLVSSVCGAVSGIASVAVYAATKAYENSLGSALGKELEPYGIGVTCIMPGAVRGTEFGSRSNSQEALCWKIPFYTKTPPSVAECGVRALLRGDIEVTPGLLNRLFLKVLKPMFPQRMHNLIAEIMWNPVQIPFWSQTNEKSPANTIQSIEVSKLEFNSTTPAVSIAESRPIIIRPEMFHSTPRQPRILTIEEPIQEKILSTVADLNSTSEESVTVTSTTDNDQKERINHNVQSKTDEKNIITPDTKPRDEQNHAAGEKNPANDTRQQQSVEQDQKHQPQAVPSPQHQPSPSSELDVILDQYKRHRSISIDDPWKSNGYNDRFIDSHMLLPRSMKESGQLVEEQEL